MCLKLEEEVLIWHFINDFTLYNFDCHQRQTYNEYVVFCIWDLIAGMKDGVVGVLVEAPHNFLNFLYWIIGFPPSSPAPQWKFKLSKVLGGSQLWLGRATSFRSAKVFLCQVEEGGSLVACCYVTASRASKLLRLQTHQGGWAGLTGRPTLMCLDKVVECWQFPPGRFLCHFHFRPQRQH